jgi:FlaA1/EpsC-like NDP-sugar epimerase
MTDAIAGRKYIYIRWLFLRLALVVYDILAVNAAYFLALVVRFYVNSEFNVWAVKYIPAFWEFSPYYTVCALVVFGLLGLYNSLWKYASLSDMNRILLASAITCVIHIVGTLTFVQRMPITYYAFGAAFQFVMISASRFSYRLLIIERDKFAKRRKKESVNVMVVGVGESSRTVLKHFDRDPNSIARPVCVIDFSNTEFQGVLAGVPVIRGIENIESAVQKYQVDRVLLADSIMPAEVRREVREICREIDLSVQDFSSYFQSTPSRIPLHSLLEYVEGPFWIKAEDRLTRFEFSDQALAALQGKYIVSAIRSHDGEPCFVLIKDVLLPNDIQEEWVQDYQKNTGEDVSFF